MSATDRTTENHVDALLASIVEDAALAVSHLENFEEHAGQLEEGQREPDEYLDEETTDAQEVWERWEDKLYGVSRSMRFSYVLAGGGPSATLEVECDIDTERWGTSYTVTDVWLEGGWAGPIHKVEVYQGQPLWTLAERLVEYQGD